MKVDQKQEKRPKSLVPDKCVVDKESNDDLL